MKIGKREGQQHLPGVDTDTHDQTWKLVRHIQPALLSEVVMTICSLGIDCEMVGLGQLGSESALARVSIVNYHGHTILDIFVAPRERVTDWRTWVSGVRESDLLGAPSFQHVQKRVAELIEGKVLVGHAIENDLKVRKNLLMYRVGVQCD